MRFSFVFALTALAALSCNKKSDTASSGVQFPVRVATAGGEGDAVPSVRIGTLAPGDGQVLQMDLQRTPPPGTANLWACWDVPAASLPVGRAVCAEDPAKSFEITTAHVTFICRTDAEFGTVAPSTAAPLAGCGSFEIFGYQFDPALPLELVTVQ